MNIHSLYPVIWKELRERRYRNKTMLGVGIFMIGFFVYWILQGKLTLSTTFLGSTPNLAVSLVVYTQLLTMLLVGSVASTYAFYNERLEKTFEPLLCTPLNITIVWLGKVIAILLGAFLYSIMAIIILIIIFRLFLSFTISLSVPILLQIFIVSPLLTSTVFGLLGFLLLVFKNILVAKFISQFSVVFIIVFGMNFLGDAIGRPLGISWRLIALFLLISLGLMVLMIYCTRFLRKEKVIT